MAIKFKCLKMTNSYRCYFKCLKIGNTSILILLYLTGIPDQPQECRVLTADRTSVVMSCVPGYTGGEPIVFTVEAQADGGRASVVHSVDNWVETRVAFYDTVEVTVDGLDQGTHYTLHVFTENKHGRSREAFTTTARTTGSEYYLYI